MEKIYVLENQSLLQRINSFPICLILLFTNYSFKEKKAKTLILNFQLIHLIDIYYFANSLNQLKLQLEMEKNENFEFKKCQYLTNFLYNIPFWFKVVIVEDYI